jgi:ABC-type multidrug transport system ATPase subunit
VRSAPPTDAAGRVVACAALPTVIEANEITVRRGDRRVLDGVTIAVVPGEVIAIVGASGGGKSTLLAALAGMQPVDGGTISASPYCGVGFVPQDDIIHHDLPLVRTLTYAARLRLPGGDVRTAVDTVLAELGLTEFADVRVADLSGGQRKRASIAVELLARPAVLLLDEPTAGLDPASAAGVMRTLRALADRGCAIVCTTHHLADLAGADTVLALDGGRLTRVADPATVLDALGVPATTAARSASSARSALDSRVTALPAHDGVAQRTGAWRQWRSLARRNFDVLVRGRLTLAILVGAPLLVVAMFAVLFQPGTFTDGATVDASAQPMVAYWLAFAGFFFGLTYGLLQICTEIAVAKRDRFAGVGLGAYIAGKAAVLVPLLFMVDVALVVVLRVLDRIPAASASTTAGLVTILLLDSAAALLLGLFLSALVTDTAQAAMALPMVCFPAVLFAGVIVPVADMATAGRAISVVTPARWAFEAIAANLGVDLAGHTAGALGGTIVLAVFATVFATALRAALRRRL